ncbi:uncharacterized protein RJT20DRAFT_31317 [Scheffersomyces xylosifermentans]|uniref:uncharacterized protein n=1 Tax=Scheffersomyces xylosifermentans TaxID=1304137 RepID=UPI00315C92FA
MAGDGKGMGIPGRISDFPVVSGTQSPQLRSFYGLVLGINKRRTTNAPDVVLVTDFTSHRQLVDSNQIGEYKIESYVLENGQVFKMDVQRPKIEALGRKYQEMYGESLGTQEFLSVPNQSFVAHNRLLIVRAVVQLKLFRGVLECQTKWLEIVSHEHVESSEKYLLDQLYESLVRKLPISYFIHLGPLADKILPTKYLGIVRARKRVEIESPQISTTIEDEKWRIDRDAEIAADRAAVTALAEREWNRQREERLDRKREQEEVKRLPPELHSNSKPLVLANSTTAEGSQISMDISRGPVTTHETRGILNNPSDGDVQPAHNIYHIKQELHRTNTDSLIRDVEFREDYAPSSPSEHSYTPIPSQPQHGIDVEMNDSLVLSNGASQDNQLGALKDSIALTTRNIETSNPSIIQRNEINHSETNITTNDTRLLSRVSFSTTGSSSVTKDYHTLEQLKLVSTVDERIYKTRAYCVGSIPAHWDHICAKPYEYSVVENDFICSDPKLRNLELIFTDVSPDKASGIVLDDSNSISILLEDDELHTFFGTDKIESIFTLMDTFQNSFYKSNRESNSILVDLQLYRKKVNINDELNVIAWTASNLQFKDLANFG